MTVVKRIVVSGLVQGVGYRFFAERVARSAGIKDFVRNLPGGEVEVVAQGASEAEIDALVETLRRGPRSSLVRTVEIEDYAEPEVFNSFEIRY